MYFDKKKKTKEKNENTVCKSNIDMEILIGTFDVKYDEGRKYKMFYHKGIKNEDNHDYKDIIIKNIYRILMTRGMK